MKDSEFPVIPPCPGIPLCAEVRGQGAHALILLASRAVPKIQSIKLVPTHLHLLPDKVPAS